MQGSLHDGGHRWAPPRTLGRVHAVLVLRGRGVQAHADDRSPHAAAGGDRLARAGRMPPLPQLLLPGLSASTLMQLLLQGQSLPHVLASNTHALRHAARGPSRSLNVHHCKGTMLASVLRAGRRALQRASGLPRNLLQGRSHGMRTREASAACKDCFCTWVSPSCPRMHATRCAP